MEPESTEKLTYAQRKDEANGLILKLFTVDHKMEVLSTEDVCDHIEEASGKRPSEHMILKILDQHMKNLVLSRKPIGKDNGKRIGWFYHKAADANKELHQQKLKERAERKHSAVLKSKPLKVSLPVKKSEPVAPELYSPAAEKVIADIMAKTGLDRVTVIENALFNSALGIKTENSDAIVEMLQVIKTDVSNNFDMNRKVYDSLNGAPA